MQEIEIENHTGLAALVKRIGNIFPKAKKITHKCTPARYEPTGEVLTFYWEVPWLFTQKFTVCEDCRKVNVISQTQNGGAMRGDYNQETHDKPWSGQCYYAKIPSIGRDRLTLRTNLS